jgi:hypothetical protein
MDFAARRPFRVAVAMQHHYPEASIWQINEMKSLGF